MVRRTLLFLLLTLPGMAEVTVPAFFSNGMVLQREKPAPVWGYAEPGETLSITFRGQEVRTQADELGRWKAALAPTSAGTGFTLRIQGQSGSFAIDDVAVGEVWVASGQSNMEWIVRNSNDAEREIAASANPQIRFFTVSKKMSYVPLDNVQGKWQSAHPQTTGDFSAVAYFFARHLQQKLKVPIGVIVSVWGGTPAEAWISGTSLAGDISLHQAFVDWANTMESYPAAMLAYEAAMKEFEAGKRKEPPYPPRGPGHQHTPSGLYNGMIAPLLPYAIAGAIWYQGESNAGLGRAELYRKLFPALIRDWRRARGQGDFPFLFVQLANHDNLGPGTQWPEVREIQLHTLSLRNTGMAVTIDIGDAQDVHPRNKQDVGFRLALPALVLTYGENLVYSGPIFQQAVVDGSAIRVYFDHVGGGLRSKSGPLRTFEIAGSDGKFHPAEARIDGATVVVSSPSVPKPTQVRYAWANDPPANLYNAEGLPASPFRSR
jgi:sialate O-acetylesterase